ncbi:MAG: carboxypeptidase-like regulatory domain-containing protein [Bacteroidales bacterium]|nr:carboxypeptidase-like regulatory domain-containing protein [Bacteroidales bacterium]
MKRLIIIGFIFLCCLSSKAQNKYFPIKGSIISADSLTPIPNAHILSMLSYYGTISDISGYFSMLTRETDSLRISSIGFLTQYIYLKHDSIDANNFNIVMQRDTVILEEIEVFPYLNYQTVKEIISKIPVEKPMTIKGVNENIESVLYLKPKKTPDDKGILSPVQTLYNRFNKKERLKRKLEKNRKKYSKQE